MIVVMLAFLKSPDMIVVLLTLKKKSPDKALSLLALSKCQTCGSKLVGTF